MVSGSQPESRKMPKYPNYEFQYTLYRSERAMLDAIAYEWITAGGWNSAADIAEALHMSDAALAEECIRGWELDERSGNEEPENWDDEDSIMVPIEDSHMDLQRYDAEDLTAAFARFRAERPDRREDV